MVSLARTTTGLLYQSDGSMTGWSGDTSQWSTASDPCFVCSPPMALSLLGPGTATRGNGGDLDGVREIQLYVESGIWWILYGAGDGVNGWTNRFAKSDDRGLTWTRLGPTGEGLTRQDSTAIGAYDNGWLEKRGSSYYRHRVCGSAYGSPNTGLPQDPYSWDTWSASSLTGSWSGVRTNTGIGGWTSGSFQPGCTYYDGSTYQHYAAGGSYSCGRLTSSSPGGPWTRIDPVIVSSSTTGLGGRTCENPKVFYHPGLSRYVMLLNLINTSGNHTDANAIGIDSSLDFGSAIFKRTQRKDYDSPNAVGIACHLTGPDGALVYDSTTGIVPVTFDGNPRQYSPGWHLGRSALTAQLEPSANCLRIDQAANNTVYRITRSQSHTDVVIEHAIEIKAENATFGIGFRIQYRSDSGGSNCYQCCLSGSGLFLEKVVSGTATSKTTASDPIGHEFYFLHRLKISVVGNRHRAWLDGVLQYDYTDASSPITSGTNLGITCQGGKADVRNLVAYTSDTVTIAGLNTTQSAYLRGYGALPAGSVLADSSGSGTFSHTHYPLWSVELSGTDYTPSGGIWGGDTLTFSGVPATIVTPKTLGIAFGRA